MNNTPTEPHADLRQSANWLWQVYVALTQEGFTDRQALIIIGNVLTATITSDDE